MTIAVAPLKGYNSLRAFQAFNTLCLGLKMMPAYLHVDYPAFFESFQDKTEDQKETAIREALAFVELSKEEIGAVLSFACDGNGIPYGRHNIDNMGPDEIFETIVAVMMEIVKIKITLVTHEEKKKFPHLAST